MPDYFYNVDFVTTIGILKGTSYAVRRTEDDNIAVIIRPENVSHSIEYDEKAKTVVVLFRHAAARQPEVDTISNDPNSQPWQTQQVGSTNLANGFIGTTPTSNGDTPPSVTVYVPTGKDIAVVAL